MEPEDWTFGYPVRGYAWRSSAARGCLLLQHGYAEYAGRYVDHYNGLIPRLLELGLDVYAFDLPGHGGSPGKRGMVDVRKAVQIHLAARKSLQSQSRPLFLFGHSLGGLITAASLISDQLGIDGVILSSPALLIKANVFEQIVARAAALIAPTYPLRSPPPARGLSRISEEIQLFESDPLVYRGGLPALLAVSAFDVAKHTERRLAEWRVPVVLFHGTDDSHTDPEGSRIFTETVTSHDKQLHLIDRGRHELLNDEPRTPVLRMMIRWLDQRLPS